MDCLKLECGSRFCPAWTNVDLHSCTDGVTAWDLLRGLPFPDESFDVAYHSHLLEHIPRRAALEFAKECFRVLRPGGVTRVVVPDLEVITRTYLRSLKRAISGDPVWEHNYDWDMLEMYDQTVRESSGGAMVEYLAQESIENELFVIERCGTEAVTLLQTARDKRNRVDQAGPERDRVGVRVLRVISSLARRPSRLREVLVRLLLGREYGALQVGRFRQSGEVHQWMYDRYSLAQLLVQAGFSAPRPTSAATSSIPGWQDFCLDVGPDGSAYKPDSLYVEADKL